MEELETALVPAAAQETEETQRLRIIEAVIVQNKRYLASLVARISRDLGYESGLNQGDPTKDLADRARIEQEFGHVLLGYLDDKMKDELRKQANR
ncbi:MAG: hypothetical protein WC775_03610 [Patescibacteria group bacterium]|jgi:hypothetical protein